MSVTVTWDYPKELFDEDGYPTGEALDYIKNWSALHGGINVKFGYKFGKGLHDELIAYIKQLWWMSDDAIDYQVGLLELHTYGWSGNESIVEELRNTDLWTFKFRAETTGGHYYFKIDNEAEQDWWIIKTKDKS